jgi:hypothetical protein
MAQQRLGQTCSECGTSHRVAGVTEREHAAIKKRD